jgi:hypothetical protein
MSCLYASANLVAQHCTSDNNMTLQGSDSQPVQSGHKRCHPDCTKRGNCNLDTGQCECPFGLAGRACSQLLLPACRLVNLTLEEAEAQGHALLLTCAQASHRNCECYRWAELTCMYISTANSRHAARHV